MPAFGHFDHVLQQHGTGHRTHSPWIRRIGRGLLVTGFVDITPDTVAAGLLIEYSGDANIDKHRPFLDVVRFDERGGTHRGHDHVGATHVVSHVPGTGMA